MERLSPTAPITSMSQGWRFATDAAGTLRMFGYKRMAMGRGDFMSGERKGESGEKLHQAHYGCGSYRGDKMEQDGMSMARACSQQDAVSATRIRRRRIARPSGAIMSVYYRAVPRCSWPGVPVWL